MAKGFNDGYIVGKVNNLPCAKVVLQALIGDPSGGAIQIYNDKGLAVPTIYCFADLEGYFAVNFFWSPTDIGKMLNTDFRAKLSVIRSTTDSSTIVKDGVEAPLVIAVSFNNIHFNPLKEFFGKGWSIIKRFLDYLFKTRLPSILFNQVRPSTEVLVILGTPGEITL